jgi:probable rRNA maturation factor
MFVDDRNTHMRQPKSKTKRQPSKLSLSIHAPIGKAFIPFLRRHLPTAATLARSSLRELSIVLLNDKAISELHQQFFNDPATTDVITFPLELSPRGRAISGELYLCVPMARRQAKLRGIRPEHELLLYAIHGILHLSGHDDTTAAAYNRMHAAEDRILRRLGIGTVFAAPVSSSKSRGTKGRA